MQIQALKLAGWRYSKVRDAWVHRAFKGRVGPVFVDPTHHETPRITAPIVMDPQGPRLESEERAADIDLFDLIEPSGPPPLPRRLLQARQIDSAAPEQHLPSDDDQPDEDQPDDNERVEVHVQLSALDEPRVVRVDGRPPRPGADHHLLETPGVPLPLPSVRAFG